MTLENTLLEKLSEWRPRPGRQDLHVAGEGWHVTVTADRSDVLGCLLWELNLQRDGSGGTDVQTWATNAAARISGLMEPLKVVEVDSSRQAAQLRSESPLERGEKRYYYELLLNGLGVATLRRFQTLHGGGRREQITYALTHEALTKLVGDLTRLA